MAVKNHKPSDIIGKLRGVEIMLSIMRSSLSRSRLRA